MEPPSSTEPGGSKENWLPPWQGTMPGHASKTRPPLLREFGAAPPRVSAWGTRDSRRNPGQPRERGNVWAGGEEEEEEKAGGHGPNQK